MLFVKSGESEFERVFAAPSGGTSGESVVSADWETSDILFKSNPQPMWIYERGTLRFLAVNDAAIRKYGYAEDEFLAMTLAEIRPEEDLSRLQQKTVGKAKSGYDVSAGWRHRAKDGSIVYVNVHTHEIIYREKDAVLAMVADVTQLFETIEELEKQKAYFKQLFDNSPEGIVLLDRTGAIQEANEGFQKMFGYSLDELVGRTPLSLIVPGDAVDGSMRAFNANVNDNEPARLTSVRQRKDGELVSVEVLAYPLYVNGEARGVFAIYQDTTEKQRALREIEYQARHDALTGLANRVWLSEVIERQLNEQTKRRPHAFLYIDLDQFKVINDTFGHGIGDRALIEVGELLKTQVRDSDLVARLGSDEFGVLLPNCKGKDAERKAGTILSAIGAYKFVWQGQAFPLGASIGIVELDERMRSVEHALSAADAACYAAKDAGRNRVRVYSPSDEDIASRRNEMTWIARLRAALNEDRFVLFFQEIHGISDASDGVRHREILIRYQDEEGRLVPPGAFVPSAERYGLMPAVDRWVLKKTCVHLANRLRQPGNEIISINLSGTTLSDETFPKFVKDVVTETGVDATRLCFEITETAAISNLTAARKLIKELKGLGSSIALDDFGSGMSSFSYLRTLSIDYLKIDGTFVREMHKSDVDYAMTEAINRVGKILGLKTVAEFVENQEIYDKLKLIGVDYAQGYGLHVPERWIIE